MRSAGRSQAGHQVEAEVCPGRAWRARQGPALSPWWEHAVEIEALLRVSPRNAASAAGGQAHSLDGVWQRRGGGRAPGSPPGPCAHARPREDGTLSGAAGLACSSPGLRRHAELGCAHPRAPSRGPQRVPVPSLASPPPPPRFGTFSYLSNQHSAFLHLGGLKRRQTFSEVKELTSHSCFRERSSGCCGPPALGNLGSLREDVHVPGAPDGGSGSP